MLSSPPRPANHGATKHGAPKHGAPKHGATKHGAIAFSLGTLADLRREGTKDVHISCVCPDGILTPMIADKLDDLMGKVDGVMGQLSRTAVKAMQVKYGLPADSWPTAELLTRMRGPSAQAQPAGMVMPAAR